MERIREEVRQESSFCILHSTDITNKPQRCAVADTSYYSVETDSLEFIHKWLRSNPVITKEHHRFFSTLMCDVHHFFGKLCHFSSLELLEIQKLLGRNAIRIVHVSLINNILWAEWITCLFFKLLQDVWAD